MTVPEDPGAATNGCVCSCHLRRDGEPTGPLHDGGTSCPCRLTPEERREAWDQVRAGLQEWRESSEFKEMQAREAYEERSAREWGERNGVRLKELSGPIPVVIDGEVEVEGTPVPFWFRERHGSWRLHLGDMDGEVVATGSDEDYTDTTSLLALVADRVRRAVRVRICPHPERDPRWRYCPLCGSTLQ